MVTSSIKQKVMSGEYDNAFEELYGKQSDLGKIKERYLKAIDGFEENYGKLLEEGVELSLFSVPGRSEISGNHTDHNNGRVLAASISLDIIAVAAKTEKQQIRIKSEGFAEDVVELSFIERVREDEKYKASAIIRGMCDGFNKNGYKTGGFFAYTTSNVLKGSGLSSSAAFEVMVGNILNHYFNNAEVSAVEIAKLAQYAENTHFGKPCGLMDQTACAVGGFVAIDFKDPQNPKVEKLSFDLEEQGLNLCIVNTGGNHADLNEDYASIPSDMKKTARYLGVEVLAETTKEKLLEKAKDIRLELGDMCLLRSLHFFNENRRVQEQKQALEKGDIGAFLEGVKKSGSSSATVLENVYTIKNVKEQGLSVALAIAADVLENAEKSAYRVHGGGFAGTIQAFVPKELTEQFKAKENEIFGEGSVYVLSVRKYGAVKLENLGQI